MSNSAVFSFAEFKERFYSRFPSLEVFDCGKINLVKVVLEGLKVNYAAKGNVGHRMEQSNWSYGIGLGMRRLRNRLKGIPAPLAELEKLRHFNDRPYLFIDPYLRMATGPSGGKVSFYYHQLAEQIGREKIVLLNESNPPSGSDFDVLSNKVGDYVKLLPLEPAERIFREELAAFFKRISPQFSAQEQLNIGVALEKFFGDYRLWRYLLKFLPQKKIVLLCHYHREGSIHAMREAGRTVIELQHGLISPEDIFYCLPALIKPVRERALFPDRIFVFGEYWKQQLLKGFEFSAEQIEVLGYYPFETDAAPSAGIAQLKSWIGGRKLLLFTTQVFLHEPIIRYVNWLSKDMLERQPDYAIIVKIHPSEKPETYAALNGLSNVQVVNESLQALFQLTSIHVSIYSTTLYDAIRSGVRSFSLDCVPEFSGYVQAIIRDGIAARLEPGMNPVDVPDQSQKVSDKTFFYAPVQPGKLEARLQ